MTNSNEGALSAALALLARQFPSTDHALAEIARLEAERTLPRGAIHVLSDVHGEDVKLRHVINNASGTLRPVVEQLVRDSFPGEDASRLTRLVFYPREMLDSMESELSDPERRSAFARRTLPFMLELIRTLARRHTVHHAQTLFPAEWRDLLTALLFNPGGERAQTYRDAVIDSLVRHGHDTKFLRLAARLARDLAVEELIIAGDCFDRGPRADRVIDYLMHQPRVSITWGNHDAAWMGAALGHEALIAHVIRVSARYRRLSQLEEGYGITLQPLEHLARTVYKDDPATHYTPKGTGLRETLQMARLQKAAAIMQYKLEGQMIARNPAWNMEHRRLMHRLDPKAGTLTVDGVPHALHDAYFPTLDLARPYELSPEERTCMDRLKQSFLSSNTLWDQTRFLANAGSMWLVRDDHLIFHGCVPVDEQGNFQTFTVDGQELSGKALFDALERVVVRALDSSRRQPGDLDLFWYLWCGPCSPLFGKDRIATMERDVTPDKDAHTEHKNAYFKLIHDAAFCEKVLSHFGVDAGRGLIVNGHVPVKLEKGEEPMKKSGKAITIDGAFSPAYGDHGFTLVLEAERTTLAKHHHFDSVAAAVAQGVDIVPAVSVVREWSAPRRVADTEQGRAFGEQIQLLEKLVDAYRSGAMRHQ